MKKNIFIAIVLGIFSLTACNKASLKPAQDTKANVVLYTYAPGDEYDSDNSLRVRLAFNPVVEQAWLAAIPTENVPEGDALVAYVKANGSEVKAVDKDFDFVLEGMKGENTIVAMVYGKGEYNFACTDFMAYSWSTVATGVYTPSKVFGPSENAKLQICDQSPNRYRVQDAWGKGSRMFFELASDPQTDGDGDEFYYVHATSMETGSTYGSYGMVYARDVAAWQGDDSYIEWNVFYPEYNYLEIYLQYYVGAGSLGYGPDHFTAAE